MSELIPNGHFDYEIYEILGNEVTKTDKSGETIYADGYAEIYTIKDGDIQSKYLFEEELLTFEHVEPGYLHVAFQGKISSYRTGDGNELTLLSEQETYAALGQLESDPTGTVWGWSVGTPLYRLEQSGEEETFRLTEIREVNGVDLMDTARRISVGSSGPVIVTGSSILRWNGAVGDWETGVLETGMGIPDAQVFIETGTGISGHLVYYEPETACNLIYRVSWEAGAAPGWERVPWVDMRDIGKVIRVNHFSEPRPGLMVVGMKGILMAELGLSEQIPVPRKPVIWDAGNSKPARPDYEMRFREQGTRFLFGSPGNALYYPVRYQTRLSGLQDEWSEPTEFADKEIGQLFEGDYQFEVRAIDPYGRMSPVNSIHLSIQPPWYRSGYAFSGYILAASLFILVVIKLRERQLRVRQVELESLVDDRTRELNSANAIKDDFIANLSHEIRNPLNGVIGLIRQLKEGATPADGSVMALRSAADYLHRTVEEVLDFSKLETGKISVSKSRFNLEEMATGVIQIYRRQAEQKGLHIDFAIWNPDNLLAISDESKVQQILGNLVNNSVKFTDAGKISVEVGLHAVDDGPELRIRVKDTGRGLSEEDQQKVFDKFYQVQHGEKPVSGTGLGLTLVKAFSEKLGGRVHLESAPDMGTEVTVIIPVDTVATPQQDAGDDRREDLGLKVLIVEDMEYNRLHLVEFLRGIGCEVTAATDGTSGLEAAREHPFDFILLDWELPGINGYEIAKALRGDAEFPASTRIIAMTAYTGSDVRDKCMEAGMNAFLSKPLDVNALYRELIRRYVVDAGNLAEMSYKGDWESHKARWMKIFEDHCELIEQAFESGDVELVAKESHGLLGHLRMIRTVVLGDCLLDLMTAAKAGDLDGSRMEWRDFTGRRQEFLREFRLL